MEERLSEWLIIGTSLFVSFLFCGVSTSFGSFLIPLLDTFSRDRASTTTIASLHVGFTVGFGVISGATITRFGLHRVALLSSILVTSGFFSSFFATSVEYLYVSLGMVTGIGNSMGFISSIVAVARVSTGSKRMLLLSIHVSVMAFAGMAFPYLIKYLYIQFGLKGTFLILSAVQGNAFAFSVVCLMNKAKLTEDYNNTSHSKQMDAQNRPKENSRKIDPAIDEINNHKSQTDTTVSLPSSNVDRIGSENAFNDQKIRTCMLKATQYLHRGIQDLKSLMSEIKFILNVCSSSLTDGSLNNYLALMVDICVWRRYSYSQGIFIYIVYNIATAITRLMIGVLKQRLGISVFVFPLISTLSACVVGIVLYFGTTYVALIAASSFAGIATGTCITSMAMIAVKLFPQQLVPFANGLQYTSIGTITAIAGPVFGKLRDLTGSYNVIFMTISAINGIGVVLSTASLLIRTRENKKDSRNTPSVYVIDCKM